MVATPFPSSKKVLVFLLTFMLLVTAGDSELFSVPLDCPFCGVKFIGVQGDVGLQNAGIDSDFCTYSVKGSVRAFTVQCCPKCGYCDCVDFFLSRQSTPAEKRDEIHSSIKRLLKGKRYAKQEDVPIYLKFRLALESLESRGAPDVEIAQLAHTGAWAVRDKIAFRAVKEEYRTPLAAFKAFAEGRKKLEITTVGDFNTAFGLLQLTVRLGLPASRKGIIESIKASAKVVFSPQQVKDLEVELQKFETDALAEAELMSKAARHFELLLAKDSFLSGEERLNVTYLVGELHRRCGRVELAKQWLKKADTETQRPDRRKLIPILLANCEDAKRAISFGFDILACPLCGRETPCLPAAEPDYLGGMDTDFATYSLDSSAYSTEVTTCLHCLYSRYRNNFVASLPESSKISLKEALGPWKRKIRPSSPRAIKIWYRYELTAECLAALKSPASKIAMSYVSAAWAVRRTLCSPTLEIDLGGEGILFPETARSVIRKTADGTFIGDYRSLLLAHRAGLCKLRDKYLKRARRMIADVKVRETLIAATRRFVTMENEYIQKALPFLISAALETEDGEFYLFLQAECYRRLGKTRKAKAIYKKCTELPKVGGVASTLLEQL